MNICLTNGKICNHKVSKFLEILFLMTRRLTNMTYGKMKQLTLGINLPFSD